VKGTVSPELVETVRSLLRQLGEDPEREGLRRTPERAARALGFFTQGYDLDPRSVVGDAVFEASYDEMVVVRDIEVYSLCEHHLLPFYGRCHIAYLPRGKIVGLSKLARLVEVYARRLQAQERHADRANQPLQPGPVDLVLAAQMRDHPRHRLPALVAVALRQLQVPHDPAVHAPLLRRPHIHDAHDTRHTGRYCQA